MCPQNAPSVEELPALAELAPYVVAICDGDDNRPLALCGTSSVAYAAFYAAVREHFGRRLTLQRGDQILATSRLN